MENSKYRVEIWNTDTDGRYCGDLNSHRETVEARLQERFGPNVRCQFSTHGANRWSVQVFNNGTLLEDIDL